MAIELKYGQVTLEKGTIGETEPVIVFRAKDKLLPEVLFNYYDLCQQYGCPQRHLDLINKSIENIKNWQKDNETKIPSSDNYKEEN